MLPPSPDEMSTVELLRLAYAALAGQVAPALQAAGHPLLRRAHESVFVNVERGGIRLTRLADKANMTAQAMGELVDDLVDMGYVERVRDPADGRAKLIRLTEKGQEVVRFAQDTVAGIEAAVDEVLGRRGRLELRRALERILANSVELAQVPWREA
jgi:DNA-binding MarR family transcriptional regulator